MSSKFNPEIIETIYLLSLDFSFSRSILDLVIVELQSAYKFIYENDFSILYVFGEVELSMLSYVRFVLNLFSKCSPCLVISTILLLY